MAGPDYPSRRGQTGKPRRDIGRRTVLVLLLATPCAFALSLRPVRKTRDVLFFFIST